MPRRKLTNLFLYRRRVQIAYVFMFVVLASMLVLSLLLPGGITPAEKASTVQAISTGSIGVNAPYYLLQRASVSLFGLSAFSIKLPSLLLGALLGFSLFMLLRRWLTLAIAVFCAIIIFAGTTFPSLSGTGSPTIMYVLFPALLLFFGTRVIARERGLPLFAVLLLLTIGLALLTPTMVYLLVLAIVLAAFNPHVRYGFRRLGLTGILLLILGFLLSVAPLAYLILNDPSTARQILALPSSLSFATIASNFNSSVQQYGSYFQPGLATGFIVPLIGLAEAGLAMLGLYRIIRAIYTARAQFIIGWLVISIILTLVAGLNILLYLPVALLASIGLSQLAAIWYRTFPLNPYARISALIPIGVLIAAVVIGSTVRYVDTTLYAKGAQSFYSTDLSVLQHYLTAAKIKDATLAVAPDDVAFYQTMNTAAVSHVVSIEDASAGSGTVIAAAPLQGAPAPIRIVTDARSVAGDRFYVYR